MADADPTRERCDALFVEDLGDETHALHAGDRLAVRDGDPRALLAAVLKREEPEEAQTAQAVLVVCADANEPTLFVWAVGSWINAGT